MNKAIGIALAISAISIAILAISLHGQPVTAPPQDQAQPATQEQIGPPPAEATVAHAQPTKPPMTRDDFDALVLGKTKDEVIRAVGKPDSTYQGSIEIWNWKNLTYDPVTGKVDGLTTIDFEYGVAKTTSHS